MECSVDIGWFYPKEAALAAWNRRAEPTTLKSTVMAFKDGHEDGVDYARERCAERCREIATKSDEWKAHDQYKKGWYSGSQACAIACEDCAKACEEVGGE